MDHLVQRRRRRKRGIKSRLKSALRTSVPLLLLVILVLLSAGLVSVMERDTMVMEGWSETLAAELERTAPRESKGSDLLAGASETSGPAQAPSSSLLPESPGRRADEGRENAATEPETDPEETLELLMDSLPPDLYKDILSSGRSGQLSSDEILFPGDAGADPGGGIDAE